MFGKILLKSVILSLGAMLFFSPIIAEAITCPPGFTPKEQLCVANNPFQSGGGIASAEKADVVVLQVINTLLLVSGSLAILFVIIGGFKYIGSRGIPELAKKGKSTIVYALVGLAVVVMSYVIVLIITNFLKGP